MGKYPWSDKEAERREERRSVPKKPQPIKKNKEYKIPPKSKKLGQAERIYHVLRKDYLKDHPVCECGRNNCKRKATDIHHKKGRGEYLNDVRYLLAVSRVCHQWIETHPKEAKELGLSISRHTPDQPMNDSTVIFQYDLKL